MKNLHFFIFSLLFIGNVFSQDMRFQISDDSTPVKGASYAKMDSTGKIWIAYVTNNSNLIFGYYYDGVWNKVNNYIVPNTIFAGYSRVFIDDSLKVLYCYYEGFVKNKIGYWYNKTFKEIEKINYQNYQITQLKNGRILCCWSDDDYTVPRGIKGIFINDTSFSKTSILSEFPKQPFMEHDMRTPYLPRPVQFSDSLYFATKYEYRNGMLGSYMNSVSYVEALKSRKKIILDIEGRFPLDSGWTNDILGLGNSKKNILVVVAQYYLNDFLNIHNSFFSLFR